MRIKSGVLILKFCCSATILTGFVSFFGAHENTQFAWFKLFEILNPSANEAIRFSREAHLLNAIVGGLMIGWGVTLLMLLQDATTKSRIWKALITGLVAWYLVDSTGSYFSGFYLNIVLNSLFFIPFVVGFILIKPMNINYQ